MSFIYYDRVKALVLGDSRVGKAALMSSFKEGKYVNSCTDIETKDFILKKLEIEDQAFKFQLIRTKRIERFRSITQMFYRSASMFLLVYDITTRETFGLLSYYMSEIEKHCICPLIMIIGNKTDLEDQREVSKQEGLNFANEFGALFVETSWKEFKNVNEAFLKIITHFHLINEDKNFYWDHEEKCKEILNKSRIKF